MFVETLAFVTRVLVGAYPRWHTEVPSGQALFFANHTSHMDTMAVWSALPPALRREVRAVAAADYWSRGPLRRRIAEHELQAILIDRRGGGRDALAPVHEALAAGQSLLLFPEGTRHASRWPHPFKSGLYHLAKARPEVPLYPVYLDNLHRAMPKGASVPLPIACTVHFGAPIQLAVDETKEDFLARARRSVSALGGAPLEHQNSAEPPPSGDVAPTEET